ncbi:putative cardiolipin synthase (CMP-forming) [Hypsizygus marmoreus]|uniref:Cardiolipin synthase (CMP-forming) n=1 Tax=Hypsizygus marmoreus TaxID=39966 RepID=A0A369J915_HYPMA|nr:putative cardiolipin synthase (CMP-forming) [Hypsizygus marmoreus]
MLKPSISPFSSFALACRHPPSSISQRSYLCNRALFRWSLQLTPCPKFSRQFSTQHRLCFPQTPVEPTRKAISRENIYTLPNILTTSRIIACPILGWSILQGDFQLATALLVYAGLTDLADGYLARRYKMQTVLGTILDPAADKTLMTTLTVTLAMQELLPIPVAVIIIGRDVLLSLSAFYIRYTSLPEPKTFSRYWDFSLPSAEIRPTLISKVNTALQLTLMGTTTISPLLPIDMGVSLQGLQWVVATTTIWSGFSYIFSKDAVRVISKRFDQKPPSK